MLRSAKDLKKTINYISPEFIKHVKPSSMLTLVVEDLFRNDMPIVFAYIFGPTIKEVLKELTDCGYHYFTGSGSHYEHSDQLPLQFEDLPIIPKPSAVTMVTKDQEILRHWRDSFGKSVRQLTIRNQRTKDNVGTLPLYAYTPAPTVPVPIILEDATATVLQLVQIGHIQAQERKNRTLLYPADSVVFLKPGYPPDLHITATFSLGIITDDVIKDDHCYSVKVTLFLPSLDDSLTFCPRANVTIYRDTVAIQAEGTKVISTNAKNLITLSDEEFSAVIWYR